MNPEITAYITAIGKPWQAEMCTHLRQIVHQAVPGVEERIQYGKPHFLMNGEYLCTFGTAKDWITLTIFHGRALQAPEGFFEPGGSPERKTIKMREGQAVDEALLAELFQQAAHAS